MTNKFYVTTPIYYPNDVPHIGHAYTTIAADILARWNRICGKKVFFTTGTDEHGKKIQQAAEKNNSSAKKFVDTLAENFKNDWKKLDLTYDSFIRTTSENHKKIVQEILKKVYEKGDIYLGKYQGYYCTSCEAYYTKKDLKNNLCPIHKKEVEWIEEETYFFKLFKYRNKLLNLYKKNIIAPEKRKKEIINRVESELKDLSISRKNLKWGIELPFDKTHVTYVWFDALINYYSAVQEKNKNLFWPPDIQIIGKDILWFHAVYWPAILMSAELELPKKIFAHGWWTNNNEKISKTTGNVIGISDLISIAGVNSARYFLFRETSFGQDGNFSKKILISRHNNELANKLGNLISRTSSLIEKNGITNTENKLAKKLRLRKILENYELCRFDKILYYIFEFIDVCNEYIQNKKIWKTKDKKALYELADSIKIISILLYPFIPGISEKISQHFGFEIKYSNICSSLKIHKINKTKMPILFEKIK